MHTGHLILAQQAFEQYALDRIWLMPSGLPAHKSGQEITDTNIRSEMVRLAIQDNPHFEFSSFELERAGSTYTYETVKLLKKQYPKTVFYFIAGADSLFTFDEWRYPEIVSQHCILLVANRSHADNGVSQAYTAEEMKKQADYLKNKYETQVQFLDYPCIDISSSMLRRLAAEGKSIRYYVPEPVYKYVKEHRLYKTGQDPFC